MQDLSTPALMLSYPITTSHILFTCSLAPNRSVYLRISSCLPSTLFVVAVQPMLALRKALALTYAHQIEGEEITDLAS